MQKLGFIGLGRMGSGIAMNLVEKGYEMSVYNRSPEKLRPFEGKAAVCASPAEVLRLSEVVFLCLSDSASVESVMEELFAEGVKEKIILDMTTSFPTSTRRLCARAEAAGGHFLDHPLGGGPEEARSGALGTLIGGDPEVISSLTPLINDYCAHCTVAGGIGSAHTMKLMMNFYGLMSVVVISQMFPLAEKMGLEPGVLLAAMRPHGDWTFNFYAPKIAARSYEKAVSLNIVLKDLTYVKWMFEEQGVPAFALDGALSLLRTAVKEGRGEDDFSTVAATMYGFLGI